MNNGNCTNLEYANGTFYGYECECPSYTYGTLCENKIDYCANVTCSGHGKCSVVNTTSTKCTCFYMYLGDDCSIESTSMKTTKAITSATSIIAFIMIALFYLIFILLDVMDFLITDKPRKSSKQIQKVWYRSNIGDAVRIVQNEEFIIN